MPRALAIAAVAALLGAFLLFLYLRQFEQTMSGGERIALLTTTKPLQRGQVLTDDMLSVRDVPLAYVETRAVKATERAKVLGVRVGQSLNAQDLVMWTDLAIAPQDRDLSSLIQFGSRAVTVRVGTGDETKGFALIHPGDYLDVLATASDGHGDSRSSAVLLQKVLVLAVGLETTSSETAASNAKDDHNRQRDFVLTLSLNLQEAQLIALASEKSRLSVALRNPEDQSVVEAVPDVSSTVIFDNKARGEMQQARRIASRPAVPTGPIKIQ
jgi:pilus assembly protein CpaB